MESFPGGESGIRTHGTGDRYNGFRDRRLQPLGHLSTALPILRARWVLGKARDAAYRWFLSG